MRRKTTTPKNEGVAMLWMTATGALVAVASPFDQLAVDGLRALPAGARRWDAAERLWLVSPLVHDEVVEVLRSRFAVVDIHASVTAYVEELRTYERRARAAELRRTSLAEAKVIDFEDARRRVRGKTA